MSTSKVSFVVPCYKLAHLLAECVNSILAQTYGEIEILIMDDSSPDNTAQVASSFHDSRVRYVRNDCNLGHLRNYNRGIELARGDYIWLISADDRLRVPYIVEQYVNVMERFPRVGYACCPARKLRGHSETVIEGSLGHGDRIYVGEKFVTKLLQGNFVIAASGMVRRACYQECGAFPLDLPFAGDWYLWMLFALSFDVAYFAEPMVNYRAHDLSMTNFLMNHRALQALREGFPVLWRIRKKSNEAGRLETMRRSESALARLYAQHLIGGLYEGQPYSMSEEEITASVQQQAESATQRDYMQAKIWTAAGDAYLERKDEARALLYYSRALHRQVLPGSLHARRLLLKTKRIGQGIVRNIARFRRAVSKLRREWVPAL